MPNFCRVFGVLLILALPIALGGCPAAIVGGLAAAGGAGYAANQERGAGGSVDDFTIKTNIQSAWMKANPSGVATILENSFQLPSFVAAKYDAVDYTHFSITPNYLLPLNGPLSTSGQMKKKLTTNPRRTGVSISHFFRRLSWTNASRLSSVTTSSTASPHCRISCGIRKRTRSLRPI